MRTERAGAEVWKWLCAALIGGVVCQGAGLTAQDGQRAIQGTVDARDGSYSIGTSASDNPVLHAGIAVQLDGRWVQSSEYPRHAVTSSTVEDDLGRAKEWVVKFSGLSGEPKLSYRLRVYADKPFADIQANVQNSTGKPIRVEAIRPVAALGSSILDLGGPAAQDRVLSDSFSEQRPPIAIHNLGDAENHLHRGVGSQLIYNRQSHQSLFIGALTSSRFLTVMRLHVTEVAGQPQIAAYEVDSTGTTELEKLNEDSIAQSPPEDQVPLQLPVAAGAELASERLLLSVSNDYHKQLETYGSVVRQLHQARVTAPTPLGWWSWTAYYFGLNEGAALTNAQWEAQHLKSLGYDFFHIDEGYQYARGEYSTPNATLFPHGLASLERQAANLGLVPGIWTAPFEVSERSEVYQKHPDWLVHNAKGKPIHIGWVTGHNDRLYVLDCTNPGAQQYLRTTYETLVHTWGIRYIKLDFMASSAIEGYFYRPSTTAVESQRIGLEIIRQTVGDKVLLDKDGSVMLNPVGYVDFGRISLDTGHTFSGSKDAASGIAARYYMNRNFFVSDPDAFTVSTQTVDDRSWHGGQRPLTLDEAKVSIALAAISGGMYEIGDDLPTLGSEPERLALVQNEDLIGMARLGKASKPVDLMNYLPEDAQPSIFLLKESPRQSILTIFNWTENSRTHTITRSSLGLLGKGPYTLSDVFDHKSVTAEEEFSYSGITQRAHSVRVLKIIDTSVSAQPPVVRAQHPASADAGQTVTFSAEQTEAKTPALSCQWDFGDGVTLEGFRVTHAYTRAGDYQVRLIAHGLDGLTTKKTFHLSVIGSISTKFVPATILRYQPDQ